jgi:enterochelin esterase-like enzyme
MSVHHADGVTRIRFEGEADSVNLVTFMPGFPKGLAFDHRPPDEWWLDLDLPEQARIEYRIEVVRDGSAFTVKDPDNPESADNPFGSNSVAHGPRYRRPDWKGYDGPTGSVSEVRVASLEYGGRRHHHVYTPANHGPDDPLPMLVAHDGSDYVRYAGLDRCLEWMIATGLLAPHRILMLEPRNRHEEYIASTRHSHHVIDEVIPHVRRRHHVHGQPILLGASLGAVAAWHVAAQSPESFGGVFLQSGTFAFEAHPELPEPMQTSIADFVTRAIHRRLPMPVAMSCGRYESLIQWNRRVADALSAAGNRVALRPAWAGHDWGAWSDSLIWGLTFLEGDAGAPTGSGGGR